MRLTQRRKGAKGRGAKGRGAKGRLLACAALVALCGCPAEPTAGEAPAPVAAEQDEGEGKQPPPPFEPPPEPPPSLGGPREPELISLLGNKLFERQPDEKSAELKANLDRATEELAKDPDDPDKIIWVARRLGYLFRMNQAIEVLSEGIAKHPDHAPLYRHRGHRYISIRKFDLAIADLERARELIAGTEDEVEPDGAPNEKGIPLSSLHFNVHYHLALGYYLSGDFEKAAASWRTCLELPQTRKHDDNVVAVTDWLYMTLRRLGRRAEAEALLEPIAEEMTIIENGSYHKRCLMYKGLLEPHDLLMTGAGPLDFATQGYGVGNWHLYHGNEAEARRIFRAVIEGDYWPAFGFIAAEVDLKKLLEKKRREQ